MSQLKGYVEVEVTKIDGEIEDDHISGDDFSLEEHGCTGGGESGEKLSCSSIYIAQRDGYRLQLNVGTYDTSVVRNDLVLQPTDFELYDIKQAIVTNNSIDEDSLLPELDDDSF